jgi:hypothetical protein
MKELEKLIYGFIKGIIILMIVMFIITLIIEKFFL